MNKKQRFASSNLGKSKMIPLSISGAVLMASLASIDKNQRTVHHGEFEGTKVNSPATLQIGDSVIYWPDADKPDLAVTTDDAAFSLMAKQRLESKGYTVTKNS